MAWLSSGLVSGTSFLARLRAARANIKPLDPWANTLRSVKGNVGTDGVSRIATEAIFDVLGLPRLQRTPEAGKRIRTIMVELGWTAVRARHVTSRGRASRVRGYARSGIRRPSRDALKSYLAE
jgi:hypothetical protein